MQMGNIRWREGYAAVKEGGGTPVCTVGRVIYCWRVSTSDVLGPSHTNTTPVQERKRRRTDGRTDFTSTPHVPYKTLVLCANPCRPSAVPETLERVQNGRKTEKSIGILHTYIYIRHQAVEGRVNKAFLHTQHMNWTCSRTCRGQWFTCLPHVNGIPFFPYPSGNVITVPARKAPLSVWRINIISEPSRKPDVCQTTENVRRYTVMYIIIILHACYYGLIQPVPILLLL